MKNMSEQKQAANVQQKTTQIVQQKQAAPKVQQPAKQTSNNTTRTLLVRGYFVDEEGHIRRQQQTGDSVADVVRLMSYEPSPKQIVIAGRGLAISAACEVANKCQDMGLLKFVGMQLSQINGDRRKTSQINITMTPVKAMG